MPNVPIIGQGTSTSDDPDFASLSDEERERLAKMAEDHPEDAEIVDVTTAFFVVIHPDGRIELDQDVNTLYAPSRLASADDVISACAVAVSDLQAAKTAQITAIQMAQVGRVMQQQAAQEAEAAAIQRRMAANQNRGFKGR
jgi:hypothetical protein